MYLAILGRQPAFGVCELERLFGSDAVNWHGASSAVFESVNQPDVRDFGGSQKIGRIVPELRSNSWKELNKNITHHYIKAWSDIDYKITLGISVYDDPSTSGKSVQSIGLGLKKRLKASGGSLRLIPNKDASLNTATSHHNKLGLSSNKIELLIARSKNGTYVVAESIGSQNVSDLAARDQARPKTDAFVGMLPPKLARMMVNFAVGNQDKKIATLLDPFCGTGVLLQEALLAGNNVYGSDLSEKMVDYSQQNLAWLTDKYSPSTTYKVEHGDATTHTWQQPINYVACETYLGLPFSAPPSKEKLDEVKTTCNGIISNFLANIHPQLTPGTTLCVAVPAWRDTEGNFTHLPLTRSIQSLGYERVALTNIRHDQLIYFRPDQVVARELLLIKKK